MARQTKLAAHIKMALEAQVLRFAIVADWLARGKAAALWATRGETKGRLNFAAGLRVKTGRAVARFTTDVHRIRALRNEPGVICSAEVAVNLPMTLFAFFGADISGTGNIR